MYGKVFTSLWDGSMRGHPDEQLVFIYLLTHCDPVGEVNVLHAKIGDDTGLGETRVREAVVALESEDASSRTPNEEGRRIVRLDDHRDWGWRIVNYEHYRAIRNAEERRRQNREAQKRRRQQKSASVSTSQQPSAESAQAYAEAEADAEGVEAKINTKDSDSSAVSDSDSRRAKVRTVSKLTGKEKDPGPRFWSHPKVQVRLSLLEAQGLSESDAKSRVLEIAREEKW